MYRKVFNLTTVRPRRLVHWGLTIKFVSLAKVPPFSGALTGALIVNRCESIWKIPLLMIGHGRPYIKEMTVVVAHLFTFPKETILLQCLGNTLLKCLTTLPVVVRRPWV